MPDARQGGPTYALDGLAREDLVVLLDGLRWADHESGVTDEPRWRALVDRIERMLEASP